MEDEELFLWDGPDPSKIPLGKKIDMIFKFAYKVMKDYDAQVTDVDISKSGLCEILGVTRQTEIRWRKQRKLPYHIRPDGSIYYNFDETYVAIKSGRLYCRAVDRIPALIAMRAYRLGTKVQSQKQEEEEGGRQPKKKTDKKH